MRSIASRAIGGLFRFLIVMAVLLFFPAGTLHYWQAWVYLLLFGIVTLAVTLHFLKRDPEYIERRLAVGPLAEKRRPQKIIQTVASVFSCALYFVAGLDQRFGWSAVPLAVVIAGNVGVLVSLLLMMLVGLQNRFTSATIEVQNEQRVIDTGLYGVVRHPMYAVGTLMFVAASLVLASYWSLVPVLLLIASMIVRLLDEERFLQSTLPGYDEYCRKVRSRLVPLVW